MTNPRPHARNAPSSRVTVELGRDLEDRLRSYVTAAKAKPASWERLSLATSVVGLSGFFMLASTPSEAEIVYTAADQVLYRGGHAGVSVLNLDVNNDGQVDFILSVWEGSNFSSGVARVYGGVGAFANGPSNGVMSSSKQWYKAALALGARIGPAGRFGQHSRMDYCAAFFSSGGGGSSGPWRNVSNRYLGLKFVIDGQTHYGWARLNVTSGCFYRLTLTGYAYETVPNQPLRAGVLPFANDSSLSPVTPAPSRPEPATLGALATGATGLSIWRGE